jgi:hypothetical protein
LSSKRWIDCFGLKLATPRIPPPPKVLEAPVVEVPNPPGADPKLEELPLEEEEDPVV